VMIGDYNGIVENLSLRVVQLRDMRGYLITIPHSAVTQVVNASRNWARIDYRVAIDAGAALEKAISTVRAMLEELGRDDAWRDAIVEHVEWIGVERVAANGVVLRASIRTAPLRQFELRRVINERVFEALKDAGIALGVDPLGPPTPAPQGSPDPV
jgi:moderate conductance mechanosensitive channel